MPTNEPSVAPARTANARPLPRKLQQALREFVDPPNSDALQYELGDAITALIDKAHTSPAPDCYLTVSQVLEIFPVSTVTLRRWSNNPDIGFPKAHRPHEQTLLYRLSEILAFMLKLSQDAAGGDQ